MGTGGSSDNQKQIDQFYSSYAGRRIEYSNNVEKIYSRTFVDSMDPRNFKGPRECCDSPACPNSLGVPIIVDTTSSMSEILTNLMKTEMKKLPVDVPAAVSYDPQILFGGVNDIRGWCGSKHPLQLGQFEPGFNEMIDQLSSIYVEGGGSGNGSESYILAHYFLARHTRLESLEKRGQKGVAFIIGDDGPTPDLTPTEVNSTFGKIDSDINGTLNAYDVLCLAEEKFHVYQIITSTDELHDYNSTFGDVVERWRNLLGGHALYLQDYRFLSPLIVTVLRMYDGYTRTEAINQLPYMERQEVESALQYHEEIVEQPVPRNDSLTGIEVF